MNQRVFTSESIGNIGYHTAALILIPRRSLGDDVSAELEGRSDSHQIIHIDVLRDYMDPEWVNAHEVDESVSNQVRIVAEEMVRAEADYIELY